MPVTAEQRALLEIQRRGARAFEELGVRWRTLPDGAERRAIERVPAGIKHRTRLEFLRALAGLPRARGATDDARRTGALLDRLIGTRPGPAPSGAAPAPAAGARTGGRP